MFTKTLIHSFPYSKSILHPQLLLYLFVKAQFKSFFPKETSLMISQDKQIDDYLSIFVPVIWFLSHTAFLLKLFRYSILEQKETMFGSLRYQCKEACEEYTCNGSGEGCGQVEHICPLYCLALSRAQPFATPKAVACQVPLYTGFPRQGYQSGLPFPSPTCPL